MSLVNQQAAEPGSRSAYLQYQNMQNQRHKNSGKELPPHPHQSKLINRCLRCDPPLPQPIPALHGSLKVPYARNPRGTDSIAQDSSSSYISNVWGIKPKPLSKITNISNNNKENPKDARISTEKPSGRVSETNQPVKDNNQQENNLPSIAESKSISSLHAKRNSVTLVEDPDQAVGRVRTRTISAAQADYARKMGIISSSGHDETLSGMTRTSKSIDRPWRQSIVPPSHSAGNWSAEEKQNPYEKFGFDGSTDDDLTPTMPAFSTHQYATPVKPKTDYNQQPMLDGTTDQTPILKALAFQAKLLSPSRQQGSLKNVPSPKSPPGYVIDGYGPPQPPTVSPISAERKAAMLAAGRRREKVQNSPSRQLGEIASPKRLSQVDFGRTASNRFSMTLESRMIAGPPSNLSPDSKRLKELEHRLAVVKLETAELEAETQKIHWKKGHLGRSSIGIINRSSKQWRKSMDAIREARGSSTFKALIDLDKAQPGPNKQDVTLNRATPSAVDGLPDIPASPFTPPGKAISGAAGILNGASEVKIPAKFEKLYRELGHSALGRGRPTIGTSVLINESKSADAVLTGSHPSQAQDIYSDQSRLERAEGIAARRARLAELKEERRPTWAERDAINNMNNPQLQTSSSVGTDNTVLPVRNISSASSLASIMCNSSEQESCDQDETSTFSYDKGSINVIEQQERRVVSEPVHIPARVVSNGFAAFLQNSRIVSEPVNAKNKKQKKAKSKRKSHVPPPAEAVVHNWSTLRDKYRENQTDSIETGKQTDELRA